TIPSTSMTSSLDKVTASSFEGSQSERMRRIVCGDRPAEQLIAFHKRVLQHGGRGGHMPPLLAFRPGKGPQLSVCEKKHLAVHSQDGQGASTVAPCLGTHQTAFYKVHSGSSQPWVRISGPSLVMATVCS